MQFAFWHKSLICKLLLFTLIFSSISLFLPMNIFASEAKADKQPKIKVLCYHHIVPESLPESKGTVVTLSEFEAQMKYLYEHGYYTASLKDIEEFLYNKKKLPENTVVITFDDGYESNYIYAYPILKKYDFKALIFLIGSRISKDHIQDPNAIPKLSYEQIREMAESGLVEFGNHTFDAHDFVDGKPLLLTMTYDQLLDDFEKVNSLFNQIGLSIPKSIAYPFGRYSDISIESAKIKGYNIGFTVSYGFVYQDSPPMLLNRIIVPTNISTDEFKALLQDDCLPLPEGFEDSILLAVNSDIAFVKGKPMVLQAPIAVVKGVCLAPLSFFTEQLKWDLIWDPVLYQVAIKPSGNVRNNFCVPVYMIKGQPMVPINPLAKAMGYEVLWLEDQQMITLKKP
ncbi:polysaccharide deacetylase family protein [Tepidanaerobacter sp. GT38]|uniref:polysaccharide deacetylase family protein n=1 Tax=Tepidanaerobacter sp. GT38 TaxID=2722793 RepID=UPI001F00D0BB|nr:polysaccharide deacetylase family protein [Tepidanaerobacter sp. GT38]MCG1013032.1 polysaccharide deacetylase family protein [Tepidanaerobacter sp. GT38]